MAVINAELPASTGPLAAEGGQHLPKIQYCEVQVWELDSATGFATRKQYWALGSHSVNGTKKQNHVWQRAFLSGAKHALTSSRHETKNSMLTPLIKADQLPVKTSGVEG